RAIFRYSGWAAMVSVSRALVVYMLLYAGIVTVFSIPGIPRTIGLIQPLLLFFFIAGSRTLVRFWLGGLYQSQLQRAALPKALVYGAGSAGRQLAVALANSYEMQIAGFLDDDERLHGQTLNRHPVFAADDLEGLIESKSVTHVLLAIPSVNRQRRNEILKQIGHLPVAVRTLPSLVDIAEGKVTTSDLRDLDADDLLGREPVAPNHLLLSKKITDKVVLVTGAGGSIGSELCRQIVKLKPAKLLLIELSEYALYSIHAELEAGFAKTEAHSCEIVPLLASVQDERRINEIMSLWRPDTLYHAAAYKHVPLVEHNLPQGVRNNVIGTLNTARAAISNEVADFVLISTDKAVRPTNAMGASKRLAEMCLQALFAQIAVSGEALTRCSMVRFGNVLGSSGSVIPKFREQIKDGGPITLTHADITRFFMTIPEAAQLVIQAGAMAKGGEVFVLDMGSPVKIVDLARRMVELSGLSIKDADTPEGDIEIQVTKLRPGEKLYEELLLGDDPQPTAHAKIMHAQDPFIPWHELEVELREMQALIETGCAEKVREALQRLVSGYQPSSEIADWVYLEKEKAV
ncbi:MAG: polysaccharide biosynthesis protein, partial [Pseudomonadales bacterium]